MPIGSEMEWAKRWSCLPVSSADDGLGCSGLFEELGGHRVVAFQGFADLVGSDSAFAADAPVIAAEFDDGRGQCAIGAAGVKNERDAIAELAKNFVAGFTRGATRKISARTGHRSADFADESIHDLAFGPAERDATGVACDFQGNPVGCVNDERERPGPAGLRKAIKVIGKFPGEELREA